MLIVNDNQLGWGDICIALEEMGKIDLARNIRDRYCNVPVVEDHPDKGTCGRRKALVIIIVVTATVAVLAASVCTFSLLNHHPPSCSVGDQEFQNVLVHVLGTGGLISVKLIIDELHIDPRQCRNSHGNSPLMAAVRANNIEVVKYLVDEQHWNISCLDGWSEIQEACYLGNIELVDYFLSKNISVCGTSLVEAAADGGQTEILEYLYQHGYQIECGKPHWNFMLEASFRGHVNVLKFYHKFAGKDMCEQCVDDYGNTLLHAAAKASAVAADCQLLIVKYLTEEQKCDKTVRNNGGQTPLDMAYQMNSQAIIEYLE